jgi:hypothetical protein
MAENKPLLEILFSLYKTKELQDDCLFGLSKFWKKLFITVCMMPEDNKAKHIQEFDSLFKAIILESVNKSIINKDDFHELNFKNEDDDEFDGIFRQCIDLGQESMLSALLSTAVYCLGTPSVWNI